MPSEALSDLVFLTRTDTTIGFVSQNADKLTAIKQRPPHKHYIKAVNSLRTLRSCVRIPDAHKNRVRRTNRTTFVLPNRYSYRTVRDRQHLLLLNRLNWAYTTSANLSHSSYDEAFARRAADVVIEPLGECTLEPSRIYRLGRQGAIKKLR